MDAHDQRPKLSRSLSTPDEPSPAPNLAEGASDVAHAHAPATPRRPSRHPARSSVSPSSTRTSSPRKRPSTATGTREEVTPWELYPAPDIGQPSVHLKPWPELSPSKQEVRHNGNVAPSSTSSHNMSLANFILRRRKSSGSKPSSARRSKHRSHTIPQAVPPPPALPSENPVAGPSNLSHPTSDPSYYPLDAPQHVDNGASPSRPPHVLRLVPPTPIKSSISAAPSYPSSPPTSQLPSTSTVAVKSYIDLSSTRPQHPPTQARDAQFSTADRTILKELKRNIDAKEAQFVIKGPQISGFGSSTLTGRGRHHPYSVGEVPYPRNYDREVLDLDVWETVFCQHLCNSVTWHVFDTPPTRVLDVGCGTGSWILDCAMKWKECQFVGLDVVPLHPNLGQLGSVGLAGRITWVQANFLESLPFPDEEFDYVHVKRIARGVPEDKWDFLLEEITRVMKPGAAFEMMEEDLFFPGKPVDDGITDSSETEDEYQPHANTILSWQTSEQSPESQDIVYEDDRSSQYTGSGSPSVSHDGAGSNTMSTPRTSLVALPPHIPNMPSATHSGDLPTPREQVTLPPNAHQLANHGPNSLPQLQVQTNAIPQYFATRFPPRDFTDSAISLRNTASTSSLISSPSSRTNPPSNLSSKQLPPISPVSLSSTKSPDRDSVYHPFLLRTLPKPPVNPRDHGLLELIYNEMHAARFINLSPLSLLANSLGLHFRDVRTHPPLQWTFPPRPVKRGRPPAPPIDTDTSSDDEMARQPFRPRQNSPHAVRSPPKRRRAATLGSEPYADSVASEPDRVTAKALTQGESKFITLDEAYSPTVKSSFSSPDRIGHKRAPSSVQLAKPPANTIPRSAGMSTTMHQSRLPNRTLNLDLKSLNLHLALRVGEVLACTEAMWEWVLNYQGQAPKPPLLSILHGSAETYEPALSDLTREDFDALLARFNMDMREQIALGEIMGDRYGLTVLPAAPTFDRKVFDAAWEKWCQWERQQNPVRSGYARSSNASESNMSRSTGANSSAPKVGSAVPRRISQSSVDETGLSLRRSGSLTHGVTGGSSSADFTRRDKRRFSHYDDGLGGLKRSGSLLHELQNAKDKHHHQAGPRRQQQRAADQTQRRESDSHRHSHDRDRYQFIPPPESRLSRVTRVFVAWKP